MRLTRLASLASFAFALSAARPEIPLDCAYNDDALNKTCHKPLPHVTTITPGSLYFAKLPCLDCPVVRYSGEGPFTKHYIEQAENDLLFNITLSHDRTHLLLNSKSIFPSLTIDSSTSIYADQVDPDFSRADLDTTLDCSFKHCGEHGEKVVAGRCWCLDLEQSSSSVNLDFDYGAKRSDRRGDKLSWLVTFDAIGGQDGYVDPVWVFNRTAQKMLRILVDGTPIENDPYVADSQTASTLFGEPVEEPEQRYRLEIQDVTLATRSYTFSAPAKLGLWGRIRHFFGFDPKEKDGHIVFLREQWGEYGKHGTLKNKIGHILYGWPWGLVGTILGSVLGGLLVLYGLYRLSFLLKEQSDLASWKGMDGVWDQMRRDNDGEEEEEGLLNGEERYRDEPTARLSAEQFRSKPLPSKPLPEKPLPAVPLVDDT
ncbi:hypothetical protein EJ04DRAFT_461364 [Polyplosphaeria fusca]|uniref:Uncharacterized protein n=1 Tax=Polyplosphaeria fusca TaxID=682080 RepID=A0A9P4V6D0_9PLEO|nr:hypothetical protein EJ04DRAFT_461364 [Polyplosphaeria fusca]